MAPPVVGWASWSPLDARLHRWGCLSALATAHWVLLQAPPLSSRIGTTMVVAVALRQGRLVWSVSRPHLRVQCAHPPWVLPETQSAPGPAPHSAHPRSQTNSKGALGTARVQCSTPHRPEKCSQRLRQQSCVMAFESKDKQRKSSPLDANGTSHTQSSRSWSCVSSAKVTAVSLYPACWRYLYIKYPSARLCNQPHGRHLV